MLLNQIDDVLFIQSIHSQHNKTTVEFILLMCLCGNKYFKHLNENNHHNKNKI